MRPLFCFFRVVYSDSISTVPHRQLTSHTRFLPRRSSQTDDLLRSGMTELKKSEHRHAKIGLEWATCPLPPNAGEKASTFVKWCRKKAHSAE